MKDFSGRVFNRFTVISFAYKNNGAYYWLCKCICGKEKVIQYSNLINNTTVSCGCYLKEIKTKHGLAHKHPLYLVWSSMLTRCYNKKRIAYNDYGGRGITVCDEWRNDFKLFYDWSIANGYHEGLQIDRENNDGNYEPSNCRYVTNRVNMQNTRRTRLSDEKVKQIRDLYKSGVQRNIIASEYKVNWSTIDRAVKQITWQ